MNEIVGIWHSVLRCKELSKGQMRAITVAARPLAIYNVDGQFYATDNWCSHAAAALTDGWLEGDRVECPLHGAQFNVRTGEALTQPADCPIAVFKTRVVGDLVEILIPQP